MMANKKDLSTPLLFESGRLDMKENILTTPISPTPHGNISDSHDYLFKLILVGNAAVGKSSILTKYVDNEFGDTYVQTIGVDFKIKTIFVENATCKLQIWDTTGQERFRSITSSYYKGSHIFLVIFDISDNESFESVTGHLTEIEKFANERLLFCKMLIGNKSDLEHRRCVNSEAAQQIANDFGIKYVEVSAKSGANLDEMFRIAASTAVLKKREMLKIAASNESLSVSSYSSRSKGKKSSCCCIL